MKIKIILSGLCLGIVCPLPVFAYVDPGTGGYVFQILFPIITALTAGYLFLKDRIKALLSKFTALLRGRPK